MVWYAMLCYPMLWYGKESMVCFEISMLCYEISMLCYAMVYVVKDKYSATVRDIKKRQYIVDQFEANNNYYNFLYSVFTNGNSSGNQ